MGKTEYQLGDMLESPQDALLQADLEDISERGLPLEKLRDAYVLVTGATGLVGSMLVKALACMNRMHGLGMKIMPMIRNEKKARSVYGGLFDRADILPLQGDILKPLAVSNPVDYIFHGASVTSSKTFVTQPVETIDIAITGTKNVLELAKEKRVRGMVYISSMEAFGITDASLDSVKEEDLGYIDVMNVRSSYSESKRMCELMCASYAHEYGVSANAARLAQTFGAGVSREEGRVFAQFAKSAIAGKDIVLHTKGESTGNYCYTADAVAGLLTVLLKGNKGEVYTVANPAATTRIKDMAQMVAKRIAGGKIKVIFDIPEDALTYGYAPDVAMHLNADKLMQLGWKPVYDLQAMYERLIQSFHEQGM